MPKQRSAKMLNLEKLCGGKLKFYQLDNQKNWAARFFTEGKYKTTSLGTDNYKVAKDQAISWYEDLRVKQRSGVQLQGSFFKDVIPSFLKYQQMLVKGGELSTIMAKDKTGPKIP